MARVLAGSLLIALIAGCSNPRENLPTHPRLSAEDTRAALAARSAAVKTVSAQGTITLTRPDGQSVRFDGAMAIRPPDHTRLRAWKFGQAIFDLTVTPDGVWLIAPQDSDRRDEIKRAGATAGDFGKTFSSLMGSYFDSTNLTAEEHGNIMRFRQKRPDGTSLVCDVDRRTLTPRLYFLVDPQDKTQFTLRLDHYAMTRNGEKEVPWPRRIVALSSSGRIEVELREVDLNADLPAGAFAPPRRAEKLK